VGVGVEGDVGAGVGRYEGVPFDVARDATPWRREDARSGLEMGGALLGV
jgi:hypothetical protein